MGVGCSSEGTTCKGEREQRPSVSPNRLSCCSSSPPEINWFRFHIFLLSFLAHQWRLTGPDHCLRGSFQGYFICGMTPALKTISTDDPPQLLHFNFTPTIDSGSGMSNDNGTNSKWTLDAFKALLRFCSQESVPRNCLVFHVKLENYIVKEVLVIYIA